MHERYIREKISLIFSDKSKLEGWQEVELAVIWARERLRRIPEGICRKIKDIWDANPIDIAWWKARDKEIKHDLNAFIDERTRWLPLELQQYVHKKITSYDTEEPEFVGILHEASMEVLKLQPELLAVVRNLALRWRYAPMNGRTHGQEAELQTFGKRCLTWYRDLKETFCRFEMALNPLKYSKISGAIGNYGSIEPEVEREALQILRLKPYYGATQIMPRHLFVPLAEALCQIVEVLSKIALDIRLGARSGRPIYQEPFAKKQTGSSAMPHKKNTIVSEQVEGMARMAKGYLGMIRDNIVTWEERAIEQSCVERVAWPDLFHVTIHSLAAMTKVLNGLNIYPDNMLREIIESRGCYASSEVKEFLKERLAPLGVSSKDAYRIVQLAAFNVFAPGSEALRLRENPPDSLSEADDCLERLPKAVEIIQTLQSIIPSGGLEISSSLEASAEEVEKWNQLLRQMFESKETRELWRELFLPSYLLRNEEKLYQEILGV
jgi:adenylosuccinate lyase